MMKKVLFACLAVLLTATTCLGNPLQDSLTDESLMTTSSRLSRTTFTPHKIRSSFLPAIAP